MAKKRGGAGGLQNVGPESRAGLPGDGLCDAARGGPGRTKEEDTGKTSRAGHGSLLATGLEKMVPSSSS